MLDFGLELKNIQHINLKNMDLNKYRFNENIKKSIIIYNKAVAEIKSSELDLAIKDLKTAIFYNSGFVEAIKVLGLCYAKEKDYRRAKKTFKKLAKYEMYRELANQYIENISIEKNISKTLDVIKKTKASCDDGNSKYNLHKNLRKTSSIVAIFLAIFISGIIILYKYSSRINGYANAKLNNKVPDSNKAKGDNLDKDKISDIVSREEYASIEKKLNDALSELDNYKKKNELPLIMEEIEKYYNIGEYEKAARELIGIKDKTLDTETKIKFDGLWSNIKTKYIWIIYNEANKLYKEGKYAEALPKLKIVSEIDPDLEIMPWITYQTGVCYKWGKDNVNAMIFFKRVKEKYPKSEYVQYSQLMIDEMSHK